MCTRAPSCFIDPIYTSSHSNPFLFTTRCFCRHGRHEKRYSHWIWDQWVHAYRCDESGLLVHIHTHTTHTHTHTHTHGRFGSSQTDTSCPDSMARMLRMLSIGVSQCCASGTVEVASATFLTPRVNARKQHAYTSAGHEQRILGPYSHGRSLPTGHRCRLADSFQKQGPESTTPCVATA